MPTDGKSAFCVVEGLDGTGTTTVAGLVGEALRAAGRQVEVTAEPTRGPFGRLLRRHLSGEVTLGPHAAALVFTADRREHLDQVVRPALRRGRTVVSDRYLLSTLAYQGAEGVPQEAILAASRGFDVPDVTFVLEAPDDVRLARMAPRGTVDRYEDPALAEGLRTSYASATELLRAAGHRIEVLDATRPAEELAARIAGELTPGLDGGA